MLAYKFLCDGGIGLFSGFAWPCPADGLPGLWVDADGALEQGGNGIHACRPADLPHWLNDELWHIELAGEIFEHDRGLVSRRGRLVERVDAWTPQAAAALARDCASRARDTAAATLSNACPDEARAVLGDDELPSLHPRLGAIAATLTDDYLARVAAYARDTVEYAIAASDGDAAWSGCTAYVAAVLEGYAACADQSGARTDPAFAAERVRQAAWLEERLGLPSPAHA
jgi:hypothetical protein